MQISQRNRQRSIDRRRLRRKLNKSNNNNNEDTLNRIATLPRQENKENPLFKSLPDGTFIKIEILIAADETMAEN
ncbi:14780_t:CDS:2 [Rhizophagus irregularis]|uniref:Uncharacterized protein n=1 Tax=Rhizophagus irregularis (strain DAOM 181602 / DAOM 197198 / MUCL 43194) TaxID=747089 RepID=U9TUH8_RHIID|nr:14780_t:CDS:2 [Rhizophagus irregularis]